MCALGKTVVLSSHNGLTVPRIENVPFSHLIYHRLKELGAGFPQVETLLPVVGRLASQLHVPNTTSEHNHTAGYPHTT